MPYNRPQPGVYVTNGSGGQLTNGQTVKEGTFVGVAVKQKTRSWQDGYTVQTKIESTEPYYVLTQGTVQVTDPGLSSPAVGDPVYIVAATNVITKTSTSNTPYGRIVELGGTRGTPTGKLRINLDIKTAVAADAF